MAWQVTQHQGLFVFKANWPMHPRYGVVNAAKTGAPSHPILYYVSGMLDAQLIAVNGKAEKPSCRTSWPKCSKSITMCRPLDSQNSLLHGIALREKWLKSHLPLPTQMVLGLLSTSLLNRWKGDEHTQGVSLSPRMVRNADIGYRSAKILANMSCSFNLQPNTGRVWFSTSEAHVVWAERIQLSYSASFDGCWKRIRKRGLQLQNQEDTEWYKWHQPKIWEVERSEARLTLAQMRLAETKKSPWQWASMGSLWSKRGTQECWVSLWCSLQIQTQNLNVIIF